MMYEDENGAGSWLPWIMIGAVAFLVIFGVLLAYTPVQFGTVRAVTFAGGLTGAVYDEGLNWKFPWMGTERFSILNHTYETGSNPDNSQADWTDYQVTAQTSDGQQIKVSYTVRFRILPDNVLQVLRTLGPMDLIVENVVKADSRSESRKSAQNYTADSLYTGEGILAYEAEVESILTSSFSRLGVTMDAFLVRKIDFDQDYVDAIEDKQIAAENIRTQSFNAQAAAHERDRDITLAEATKQRDILLAEAQAEQIRVLAIAQAEAIALQGEALDRYPQMIQWEFVNHLEGVEWGFLPTEGVTPLLPVPGQ